MGDRRRAAVGSGLFFVVAPFVVAGVVPWLLTGGDVGAGSGLLRRGVQVVGALAVAVSLPVLVAAFVRFVVEGVGTPAPVAPTEHLVVGGLYRHVRNPMYVAVLALVWGQAALFWRPVLLVYGALVAVAVIGFVRAYEQPTLRRTYGAAYDEYCAEVPGWWPRLRGRVSRGRADGPAPPRPH